MKAREDYYIYPSESKTERERARRRVSMFTHSQPRSGHYTQRISRKGLTVIFRYRAMQLSSSKGRYPHIRAYSSTPMLQTSAYTINTKAKCW